ncbi:hypothetical protein WSK_0923 [Novosphingobium sp. Rr 2-17]|uniref:polysaccharide pyruvyl transferase family protein n=1 Tax=Novosphingobium sp. Rr 2-17 TaxID=555793 RepID=UPI000269919D|nr:polysaccharide pyruvyl transferase family protein [Novosphingobium sp. Rr 2-17]EIZ80365.1 hypothetical protein WSK_0923 [Novosphingobium sp. Rr 2-17]
MTHGSRTIALLCARPPERNTGMVTVDLAGSHLLAQAFPDAKVELYYYGSADRLPYPSDWLPFRYRDVWTERESFLAADCRVVWGDFTHSAALWLPARDSWPETVAAPVPADIAALSFLYGHDPELLRRTISFGGTIITNGAAVVDDELYASAFENFCAGAGRVLLRDAISATYVSTLRPDERTLGIDCAFLNSPDSLSSLKDFSPAAQRLGLGVFFGRTPGLYRLLAFSREMGKQLGLAPSWLPWFHSPRRQRLLVRAFGLEPSVLQPSPGSLLSQLSGCEAILTDTYHLAINAWRMGIPAICVGTGAGRALNSLSDKKKELLYKMYGADEFYVFAEALGSRSDRIKAAGAASDALRSVARLAYVHEQIARHRERATKNFVDAVADALNHNFIK